MNIYEKSISNSKDYNNRPKWPSRVVITGGMPNGNKQLHVGHLAAVFIWADVFARFMRNNIGEENVIFVSGSDGYGSPVEEKHREMVASGKFSGTIEEFVLKNHLDQKRTLQRYDISTNLFAASCLFESAKVHEKIGEDIFKHLYDGNYVKKMASLQFYDKVIGKFLNGRQVVGQCPVEGCQSEFGWADECSLGHQYQPSELINPKSIISDSIPELKEAPNWYFMLEDFREMLKEWLSLCETQKTTRKFMLVSINDFLKAPVLFIREKFIEEFKKVEALMPTHTLIAPSKGKLYTVEFKSVLERDEAIEVLVANNIIFRTGNTLVPLRLTGDVKWGLKVPEIASKDDENIRSFWVWPESLWAPISFTETYLESKHDSRTWKDFWCDDDAEIYQFIGEDNIYFYAVVEPAMFMGYNHLLSTKTSNGQIHMPHIVANKHVLFGNAKASSSGKNHAPTAEDLLDSYTVEQLRMHFLAQGLENNSFSFKSKVYTDVDMQGQDPVLSEGNLLTNVFNRLARSIFYTLQSDNVDVLPYGEISMEVLDESLDTILQYEQLMYSAEMHKIISLLDLYIRNANKRWARNMNFANGITAETKKQTIIDALHVIRVAIALFNPIVPKGTEMIKDYLNLSNEVFKFENIFKSIYELVEDPTSHKFKVLEPKIDFFKKLDSQY